MKVASKVMYIIGMISNVLLLICSIVIIVLSIIGLANPQLAENIQQEIQETGVPFAGLVGAGLGIGIYLFIANLVVIFLARRAIKNLNEGNGRVGAHIVLLIGGVLCWDIFYVLGGIFGIIGSND